MTLATNRSCLALAAVVGIAVIACSWRDVALRISVRLGARYFRDNFLATHELHVAMAREDWAVMYFQGTMGAPALDQLTRDEELSGTGRNLAADLAQYVRTGQHVPYVRDLLREAPFPWWRKQLLHRIEERDAHLTTQQQPEPYFPPATGWKNG